MSKYTTELYVYFKNKMDIVKNPNDTIENHFIDLFSYGLPFYSDDVAMKEAFVKQFCIHYLHSEIGFETIECFKWKLTNRLSIYQSKYEQLYNHIKKANFDFFQTHTMTETYKGMTQDTGKTTQDGTQTNNGTDTNTANYTQTNKDSGSSDSIYSDTPQVPISGDNPYYTNRTKGTTSADSTSTNKGTDSRTTNNTVKNDNTTNTSNHNDTQYTRNISETSADFLDQYNRYLEVITPLNLLIIEDCNDLFMQIF